VLLGQCLCWIHRVAGARVTRPRSRWRAGRRIAGPVEDEGLGRGAVRSHVLEPLPRIEHRRQRAGRDPPERHRRRRQALEPPGALAQELDMAAAVCGLVGELDDAAIAAVAVLPPGR